MNKTKRIIVEFGARRQQFVLTDHLVSISKLRYVIGNHFGVKLENNYTYVLQMYDNISNEYYSLNDDQQIFDLSKDIEPFHRFRIIQKSLQPQKYHLLNNLQSTLGKLHSATQDIDKMQNLIGGLNHSCDVLNQLMDTRSSKSSPEQPSYLLNPSTMMKDVDITKASDRNELDDENFDSVSCYGTVPLSTSDQVPPSPVPTTITVHKQQLSMSDANVQTRIIPCKYAVRGTCQLGDKCLYLHDETCIRSAREWERRL